MPLTTIENFDLTLELVPAQWPEDARLDAVRWAPNLTISKGDPIGILTTGSNTATLYTGTSGANGAGVFKGLSKFSLTTDATGLVYLGSAVGSGTNASPSLRLGPALTAPIYVAGTFNPADFTTNNTTLADFRTGKPGAEVLHNGNIKFV